MNVNKKRIAPIFAAACVAALCAFPAGAQQADRIIATLRAPITRDFDFMPIRDARLYPETGIFSNPALLAGLTDSFLLLDADAAFTRGEDKLIRADGSIGQKGGWQTTISRSVTPLADCLFLRPLNKKSAFAVYGSVDLDISSVTVRKSNYDTLSESIVQEDDDGSGGGIIGGMYAAEAGSLDWGVSGDFSFDMSPHSFRKTTDRSTGTAIVSAGAPIRDSDSYQSAFGLKSGVGFPLSRSTALTVGISLSGAYLDESRNYRTVDSDADGINDPSPVAVKDYWLEYEVGDAANPVTSYSYGDSTWMLRARLLPGLRIALSNSIELFCDLDWDGFDMDIGTGWERFKYEDSPSGYRDRSIMNTYRNSSLTSGSAMLGAVIGKSRDSLLRVGLGYERLDSRRSQDGLDSAGNNAFSAYNPKHYPEAEFFVDSPANGAVAAAAGAPWKIASDRFCLLGAWETRPTAKISLFADLEVSGGYEVDTYYVYSLDTLTVWREQERSLGIDWFVETTAGLSFDIGKGKRLTFDCRVAPLSGSAGRDTESLPFDVDSGRDSTDGSDDLDESSPFGLRLRACLNLAL